MDLALASSMDALGFLHTGMKARGFSEAEICRPQAVNI